MVREETPDDSSVIEENPCVKDEVLAQNPHSASMPEPVIPKLDYVMPVSVAQWSGMSLPKINVPLDEKSTQPLTTQPPATAVSAATEETVDSFSFLHKYISGYMPSGKLAWNIKFVVLCAFIIVAMNIFLSWILQPKQATLSTAEISFEPVGILSSNPASIGMVADSPENDVASEAIFGDVKDDKRLKNIPNRRVITVTDQDKDVLLRYLKQPADYAGNPSIDTYVNTND